MTPREQEITAAALEAGIVVDENTASLTKFADLIEADLKEKVLELVRGMKIVSEVEVPPGENIGEYRFTHSLKNEGYNQALSSLETQIENL